MIPGIAYHVFCQIDIKFPKGVVYEKSNNVQIPVDAKDAERGNTSVALKEICFETHFVLCIFKTKVDEQIILIRNFI